MTFLSVLLLLHLIPLSAQGQNKPEKVSASQAERHLVVFKKVFIQFLGLVLKHFSIKSGFQFLVCLSFQAGTNIEEHLDAITSSTQPYLLAVGLNKNAIHQFFIILDKNAIPCKSFSSLGAID